jgi:hypothetical protein
MTNKRPSHLEIYNTVKQWLTDQPDFAIFVINGLIDGVAESARIARQDRYDWEIIACMAMEKRLFNGNEKFLADKIESMKGTNTVRWDHTVAALRKRHKYKLEKHGMSELAEPEGES